MGFFKQMKDMKKTVEAAPGLVNQAQQMGAQAQQMQMAQQAAMQQQMAAQQAAAMGAGAPPAGGDFEPIAGVSIDLYAEISKGCAAHPGDLAKAAEVAAAHGVSGDNWQAAMNGWNARMYNPAVAQRFNALYTGRA